MQIGHPCLPGVSLCRGVYPDTTPGQSSSMCAWCCVNPGCAHSEIGAGSTLPSVEAAELSCNAIYRQGLNDLIKVRWESCDRAGRKISACFMGKEQEDSCVGSDILIPFSQLLLLELALPFAGWFVVQVFSFAFAAVIHFRGGSISECSPAVLLTQVQCWEESSILHSWLVPGLLGSFQELGRFLMPDVSDSPM